MLLTIDEAKVKEFLANVGEPPYVVKASNLVAVESIPVPIPALMVGGTIFEMPRSDAEGRDYVMSVRRKIEASGVPLKSPDELNRELDEMRGRTR
jgi:hypothetical protein